MDRVTIEPAENGYIVRYDDDAIREKNSKSDSKWEDPEVRKVYPDEASMMQDLATILPTLKTEVKPAEEYTEAFNEATSE